MDKLSKINGLNYKISELRKTNDELQRALGIANSLISSLNSLVADVNKVHDDLKNSFIIGGSPPDNDMLVGSVVPDIKNILSELTTSMIPEINREIKENNQIISNYQYEISRINSEEEA